MNPTLATIHDLRSTHGDFSERPVANADLEAVLAAAVRAATASNAQNYAIVVCTEKPRITDLKPLPPGHACGIKFPISYVANAS